MLKHGSKERIGQSIDGILGNLTIRRKSEGKDELQELKKKLLAYEELGSIEELKKEKEELLNIRVKMERSGSGSATDIRRGFEALALVDRDKMMYQPSQIIREYCERMEGKRKLTIHLREIEYQAILKAAQHLHSSKGQLMDTITKALRFYIPSNYYQQAEREVSLKALQSVQGMLDQLGFSKDKIGEKIEGL